VTIKPGAQEKAGIYDWRDLLAWLFGWGDQVLMGSIEHRQWQFYEEAAQLRDRTNASAGKIGWKTEGDRRGSICISLSGNGCRWIPQDLESRRDLAKRLQLIEAKLTRLDIAVDDLTGELIKIHELKVQAEAGKDGSFCSNGRPPEAQFISDLGSGKGCTLYVGKKGHKQLCIYEKGKQLGDPTSSYTRCELRLYGNKLELPLEAIVDLEGHFAGAYPMLGDFILGEATKLMVKERQADCTVEAFIRVTRQQVGTGINLMLAALGEHNFRELFIASLLRDGVPGRFKGQPDQELKKLIRESIKRRERENDNGEDHHPG
jgi:DNA relaxase NicK